LKNARPRKQVRRKLGPVRVLAAVLEKNGRWLIAKRKRGDRFGGLWEFPGGKLEADETPREGLVRELSEELGIEVRVGTSLGSVRYSSPDLAIELIAYAVVHVSGSFCLQDHDEVRWVVPSRIGRYALTEPDRLLLQKLRPQEELKAK
jgi:8-oxo-dGTP diphosphatase